MEVLIVELKDSDQREKTKCTGCGAIVPYEELAYDGPKERGNTCCNPFMSWLSLCKDCERYL